MVATDRQSLIDQAELVGSFGPELDSTDYDHIIEASKRHLASEGAVDDPTEAPWYDDLDVNEALFWTVLLFGKVAAEELDAAAVTVGAIDRDELLAKDDSSVTTWYRNYERAVNRLKATNPTSSGAGVSGSHSLYDRTSDGGRRTYGEGGRGGE